MNGLKGTIFAVIEGMVTDFLYYDREEDEDLPLDAIQLAISKGEISVDEIATAFKEQLIKKLKE
jgi:hypothetical protein